MIRGCTIYIIQLYPLLLVNYDEEGQQTEKQLSGEKMHCKKEIRHKY